MVTGAPFEWTYSEYARLPDDGNRYEVLDGAVCVTPAPGPRHQRVAAAVFFALAQYVDRHGIGEMLWDVDLLFVTGQYLRPDMLFVPAAASGSVSDRGMEGTPGLVVEVVSPHSRRIDCVRKPPRYREFGVPEYWVVDPGARTIIRHRFEHGVAPIVCSATLEWEPAAGVPALRLDIPGLFAMR
jgi:Uma2 family endonuclease